MISKSSLWKCRAERFLGAHGRVARRLLHRNVGRLLLRVGQRNIQNYKHGTPCFLALSNCFSLQKRRSSSSASNPEDTEEPYLDRRARFAKEIDALPETRAAQRLEEWLNAQADAEQQNTAGSPRPQQQQQQQRQHHALNDFQIAQTIDAMLATFLLHVEARCAALLGRGYYTIGPCGEEALAAIAHCLRPRDSLALHYRHVSVNLCRQIAMNRMNSSSNNETDYDESSSPSSSFMEQLLLDRARGYSVSCHDPVTGGVHCCIGSSSDSANASREDYLVTSTLASQCPAAVGRALGYALLHPTTGNAAADEQHDTNKSNINNRPISMVTLGDGSVHNHHFWSAFHLARHARHKNIKCPVVFGISDNGLSISYNPQGYVNTLFANDPLVPLYTAAGHDLHDVYQQTLQAVNYARRHSAPAVVLYQGLTRRFGHAATDRQQAYLDEAQIQSMAERCVLEENIARAVAANSNRQSNQTLTYGHVRERFREIQRQTRAAFAQASSEPKVTRQDMLERVSAPIATVPPSLPDVLVDQYLTTMPTTSTSQSTSSTAPTAKREVMRKHMTRVLAECLQDDKEVVYLGEDVVHGGYYVVTEGLAERFPGRVMDFPPDETSLLGAALGMAQLGLTPIVEIPYAKYLDCGADLFHEIAVLYWLSAGKRPNGLVIRLQGFDRGLFGGNFHTSNVLTIPPGVDVCCYSNGEDYVRGFRNAIRQAKAGRVVMSVDCTHLLNLRHLHGKDRGWERPYPEKAENGDASLISFDFVRRYGTEGSRAIVTYGNGVVTALQARQQMVENEILSSTEELDVIDCPYLSATPQRLKDVIGQYKEGGVVFVDICKEGPSGSVLSNVVCSLQSERYLPDKWQLVAAPRTYNPLGNMCTFLNQKDLIQAFHKLASAPSSSTTTSATAGEEPTASFHDWLSIH